MNENNPPAGFNAYQPFYPKDTFSKELLATVPRKVSQWLMNMEQEPQGNFENLRWNFDIDRGTLIFGDYDKEESSFIQLWWTSEEPLKPENVCGTDARFENLAMNLDFFTAVEKAIYGELEKLQVLYTRSHQIPQMPPPRPEENEHVEQETGPISINAEERWSKHQDRF